MQVYLHVTDLYKAARGGMQTMTHQIAFAVAFVDQIPRVGFAEIGQRERLPFFRVGGILVH